MATYSLSISADSGLQGGSSTSLSAISTTIYTAPANKYAMITSVSVICAKVGSASTYAYGLNYNPESTGFPSGESTLVTDTIASTATVTETIRGNGGVPHASEQYPIYMSPGDSIVLVAGAQTGGSRTVSGYVNIVEIE